MLVNLERGGFNIDMETSCGWLYPDEERGEERRRLQPPRVERKRLFCLVADGVSLM